jgi:hypothetical protein
MWRLPSPKLIRLDVCCALLDFKRWGLLVHNQLFKTTRPITHVLITESGPGHAFWKRSIDSVYGLGDWTKQH